MSNPQMRTVTFGRNRANVTGSTGVGYTVFDTAGSVVIARTTDGVYQPTSGSGVYAAYVPFPDGFHGSIMWDCPAMTSSVSNLALPQAYAFEQYNVEENDPDVSENTALIGALNQVIELLYEMNYGRWVIDKANNQMVFYKSDNTTECARFNLYDDNGNPSVTSVFERRKV